MSRYYVNKFLYSIDRDPRWVQLYTNDSVSALADWQLEVGAWLNGAETTSWLSFTEEELRALETYDYVWLFENGAHFFLSLTLFIAVFDQRYTEQFGPLSFHLEFAKSLEHWLGRDYPSIAL